MTHQINEITSRNQERTKKPWIRNPFLPDRPIAYEVEFDLFKSAGVRPDFYRTGDHIYDQARSNPGQTFIINNRCSDGADSLRYYLTRFFQLARFHL